jgi:hypothetical protein
MGRPFRPIQNKFGARRTAGYASKREAEYAAELGLRKAAGDILDWLEQVPVRLPGGTKYVVDFMVLECSGGVRFVEVKGQQTEVWRLKMRQLEELRPEIFSRLEVVR